MLRVSLLACLASFAFGACPNQCSGHGWCDENERCICFSAPGTANQHLAYIGADCSKKVCPYGMTHDVISDADQELEPVWNGGSSVGFISANGVSTSVLKAFLNGGFLPTADMGLDVRVVRPDSASNLIKFQWKTSTQKTFGSEETALVAGAYTTRQTAYHVRPNNADTGLYVYFDVAVPSDLANLAAGDKYFLNVSSNDGIRFIPGDGNTAHQRMECSGRGVCDRSVGNCKCITGYTGDACQRTSCPNDCSGHGICQNEMYFVQDADDTLPPYTGFDAQSSYGCKCDRGFRGADCSQRECPSGPDPMNGDGGANGLDCSARGLCDYTTGVCKCFKGFYGERCEEISTLV